MAILLCIGSLGLNTPVYATEEPSFLYAKSAVLMDAASGRVLYGKNETEILPMASTTKIMTCILALEHGKMEELATVSSYAASMPKVHLGVKEGEQYVLKDLLYSLMLESHNDSAVVIAEHIGGSVEGFAELMNRKAKEIGCENTNFVTPNGLDGVSHDGKMHTTTAEDLAKIMSYCIMDSTQKDMFLEITQTRNYGFSEQNGKRHFQCRNHNTLLDMMPDAISGKTGYTSKAGYCYVGALENDGRTFVVALLACGWPNHKTYKWSDSKTLFAYGMDTYSYKSTREMEGKIKYPSRIQVENAIGTEYGGKIYEKIERRETQDDVTLLMKAGEEWKVHAEVLPKITAPAKAGRTVGTIWYELNGEVYKVDEIVLEKDVEELDYMHCFHCVLQKYYCF